jgi:hypothetical protein
MENVIERLQFLSATRCDISTELKFMSLHFYDFAEALPFPLMHEIAGYRSLRLKSEDHLYNFISKGIEANAELFGLLEFVRFEYCSTDTMNNVCQLTSEHLEDLNISIWAGLCARLTRPVSRMPRPSGHVKEFPPLVKTRNIPVGRLWKLREFQFSVPDGIIAHLTRECGGNVHEQNVIEVTSGSFETETNGSDCFLENIVDLESDPSFRTKWRSGDIPHTRNNWVCYDFESRRIVPTHYAIRTHVNGPGAKHLKSWVVETSADGETWQEVDRREDNRELNGICFIGIFAVAGSGECRFIRLVNIGRNHCWDDMLLISVWEIFGSLIE